jgi:L-aspartate oxidase
MDLEFIQFHPTVLYHPENKSFLISEAVRGEGALLRNVERYRFMPGYHKLNELAPRDVVSRCIFEEMKKTNSSHVYLDVAFKDAEYLENRFPNIYKTCLGYGIDITKDYIPVSPAEHYCMGGIRTDVFGRTNIEGFYACGEAACTGIHGANRLASNSLLEGLVFGRIIGSETMKILKDESKRNIKIDMEYRPQRVKKELDRDKIRSEVQSVMTEHVGIIRSEKALIMQKI